MDLPSTEKVYKHDIHTSENTFECKTCGAMAARLDLIQSQPCSKRGPVLEPGKLQFGVVDLKRDLSSKLILFTPKWLEQVEYLMCQMPEHTTWEISTQTGKKMRLDVEDGELFAHTIPDPDDFPVQLPPVSKETLLEEELDQLRLEEEMLSEMIQLEKLEEEMKASSVNSSIPASSAVAPSAMLGNLVNFGISFMNPTYIL